MTKGKSKIRVVTKVTKTTELKSEEILFFLILLMTFDSVAYDLVKTGLMEKEAEAAL